MSSDSRLAFYESWMCESPQQIANRNDFVDILNNLKGYMNYYKSKEISQNLFLLEGNQMMFVYYEENNIITIIVELEKKDQTLIVINVAKDNMYKGLPQYVFE